MTNIENKFIPLSILLILLISGCATAPPSKDVKKGPQGAYKIGGKWYYPVESSDGYEETGIASWYGKDFHGKKTSNGERYNMKALTAAHKTLPFGTYVKVTRLDNEKETIVRINDRGPFVKDRIIDLSQKAATEIGMIGAGSMPVRVEALGSPDGDRLVKTNYEKGDFYVQVGAFTVKSKAEKLRNTLNTQFGNVWLTTYDRGDAVFYRVRSGPVNNVKDAEYLKYELEKAGMTSAFVVLD